MYTLPSQFRKNSMGNIIQAPNRTMSKSEQDTSNTKTAICWTHWPRDWKSWFMICISFVLDPQPEWLYMATTYFKAYLSIIKKLLGYGLDGQGILVQLPAQTRKFSLHQSIQIGSGAHQPPIQQVPWNLEPEVSGRGVELTHFHLVPRLIICGTIHLPIHAFMVWHPKHSDNLTITLRI